MVFASTNICRVRRLLFAETTRHRVDPAVGHNGGHAIRLTKKGPYPHLT